jgi:hypothetical protein
VTCDFLLTRLLSPSTPRGGGALSSHSRRPTNHVTTLRSMRSTRHKGEAPSRATPLLDTLCSVMSVISTWWVARRSRVRPLPNLGNSDRVLLAVVSTIERNFRDSSPTLIAHSFPDIFRKCRALPGDVRVFIEACPLVPCILFCLVNVLSCSSDSSPDCTRRN